MGKKKRNGVLLAHDLAMLPAGLSRNTDKKCFEARILQPILMAVKILEKKHARELYRDLF